jgi:hypothetical protein
MTRVATTWRTWVALMNRRESPGALALVRIAASLVLLADMLWVRHVYLIAPLWSPPPAGFGTGYAGWSASFGLDAQGLWWAATIPLVLVALGLATRPACLVFAFVSAELAAIAPYAESAIDPLMRIVFVILALSRCNARWSIDAVLARRRGSPPPTLIPAWPRYLILLQLVWVYFSSGINKSSADWGPHGGFTALAHAMMDPHNGRLDPELVVSLYPVTQLATALTMLFELTAVAYLGLLYFAATPERPGRLRAWCNRWRLRWVWLCLGIAFEVGIAATLKLGAFPFGMLALFPVLLLPGEVDRAVNRVSGARSR